MLHHQQHHHQMSFCYQAASRFGQTNCSTYGPYFEIRLDKEKNGENNSYECKWCRHRLTGQPSSVGAHFDVNFCKQRNLQSVARREVLTSERTVSTLHAYVAYIRTSFENGAYCLYNFFQFCIIWAYAGKFRKSKSKTPTQKKTLLLVLTYSTVRTLQ